MEKKRNDRRGAWVLGILGVCLLSFTSVYRVVAADAPKTPLSALGPALSGQTVFIVGTVVSVKEPEPGSKAPFEVVLKEGEAQVSVVYWDKVAQRLTDNKPVVGGQLHVEGLVTLYKDKVQVKVNRADRISLSGVVPASVPVIQPGAVVQIATIDASKVKQTVTVKGTLGEPESIRGGVKYPLSDASGKIVLLLWDSKVMGPQRDALRAGVNVLVSGTVMDFKGELEIVPSSAQGLQVEP